MYFYRMKAAYITKFGSPDVFQIGDMPKPVIEKDTDVLIEVHASSVNPVDWKIRKGNLKFILGSGFPIILGFDASGVVVEVGKAVKKFKPGDEVYGRLDRKFGRAYAEYAIGSESVFSLKPSFISHLEAGSIPLAASTALQGLRDKGLMRKGYDVLINGASGGVGIFAAQIAYMEGANATLVWGNGHEALAKDLKIKDIINYHETDFKKLEKKYDIVFDIMGNESFMSCKHLLKKGGTYITSLPRPKVILHRFISLFTTKRVRTLLMEPNGKDLDYLNFLMEFRKFRTRIDSIYKLDDIAKAHSRSESGHVEGKVVVGIKF